MLIDTHVHLNHDDLGNDLNGVLARAREAGVERFVVVGYDIESSARAVALAESDSRIYAAAGIHPHDAANWSGAAGARLRGWMTHPRVVALGEIGLDYYRNLSPVEAQQAAFQAQLAIAREFSMPVVIHCRDAWAETLDVLEGQAGSLPIVLHCFQGSANDAARAQARGWFLGIGGAATFKNQEALREIVRAAPLESLLLETDAPYLSPVPLRGKYPNEPARVAIVAELIANLRGMDIADVAAITTANARRAFPRLD